MKSFSALIALALSGACLAAGDPPKPRDGDSTEGRLAENTRVPRARSATPQATAAPKPAATTTRAPAVYTPPRRSDGRRVVAIDIGHTAASPGALSATGRGEFLFNKDIAEALAARLRDHPQLAPVIINPKGAPISLPMRTTLAARAGAELFIAIHHDSAQDKYFATWLVDGKPQRYSDHFQGYGVFISGKSRQAAASLKFAKLLGGQMAEAGFEFSPHHSEPIAGENRPIIDRGNGVYRYDDLIVLKSALMPAVLLECGVIANRTQEPILRAPATHEKIVRAIVAALEQFFATPEATER